MPKMKTHKGAAKRFRITRNGKILRGQTGGNHLRRRRRKARKRADRHLIVDTTKSTLKLVKRVTAGQPSNRNGHKNTSRG